METSAPHPTQRTVDSQNQIGVFFEFKGTEALDRVELLAKKRNETVTREIRQAISGKAETIWGKK